MDGEILKFKYDAQLHLENTISLTISVHFKGHMRSGKKQ
jgi:hypothetical protein